MKTSMYNKLEEMKNGGYTLFSDRTRKMLLAMGLSLLSVGTLSQVANAEVAANVTLKKTEGGDLIANNVRYQLELTESDTTHKLAGIYEADGNTPVTIYSGNVKGNKATVVIEVSEATTQVMIKNDNGTPVEGTDTKVIELTTENVDNDGPQVDEKTLIKYVTEDGKYLQARLVDEKTKVYKVEDQDGHDRVILKEKEREKEVTLKYALKDDDTGFKVYDILGNVTEVTLSDANVETVFNARNIDGTTMALEVTRGFMADDKDYGLIGIRTGAGETITLQDEEHDIYENIPEGTTNIILTYANISDETDTKEVVLPLVLDKKGPVVVKYEKTGNSTDGFEVTKSTSDIASARAYFNKDKGKGIVEVKDVQSGVAKIVTLTGEAGSYVQETVAYEVTNLQKSVLCLFDVTENTTAVRIYDGVGDTVDIELAVDANDPADGTIVASIRKEENGTYTLLAQDTQAGLGKITRDAGNDTYLELANFSDEAGFTIPDTPMSKGELQGYAGVHYDQYTLKKFKMTVDDEGLPMLYVIDALGNTTPVSFDQFAFACHYATYNGTDSLALSVTETRGIYKILATIIDGDMPHEPTKPAEEKPESEPATPSEADPRKADVSQILEEPTAPSQAEPQEGELVTPPTNPTALEKWNNLVATAPETKPDGIATQMWNDYVTYTEQQNLIAEWEQYREKLAAYNEQQELINAWDKHYLWEAWGVWEAWYAEAQTHKTTYTLEVFPEDKEPENLTKTYQVPAGQVEKVIVYNTHGNAELYNIVDNLLYIANVEDEDRATTSRANLAVDESTNKVTGATVNATYGIKEVTYGDGCVVQFYDELPTELFVNCKVLDAENQEVLTTAVVMDAIGNTVTITESGATCSYEKTSETGTSETVTYETVTL